MQPYPIDVEKLLRVFERMYAHMLTLQDLVEADDDRTYDEIYPAHAVRACRDFEIFYTALDDPKAFADAVKAFRDIDPNNRKVQ
jgi:hypothetical protein